MLPLCLQCNVHRGSGAREGQGVQADSGIRALRSTTIQCSTQLNKGVYIISFYVCVSVAKLPSMKIHLLLSLLFFLSSFCCQVPSPALSPTPSPLPNLPTTPTPISPLTIASTHEVFTMSQPYIILLYYCYIVFIVSRCIHHMYFHIYPA